ncbi:MAG: hypothetical protein KDA37_15210, partial [Planctomycetales bacterium]|nr:hypothetical protein [Planctomycetales bacterium]
RYEAEAGLLASGQQAPSDGSGVQQAIHVAEQDNSRNQQATLVIPDNDSPRIAQQPVFGGPLPLSAPSNSRASAGRLMADGEQALRTGDRAGALDLFRQANSQRGELDPIAQARLSEHLKLLGESESAEELAPPAPLADADDASLIDTAANAQLVLARQLSTDVGKRQLEARRLRESEPRAALELLESTRKEVENARLADQYRGPLLRRVDSAIADMEKFIDANRAQIELDEQNAAVLAEIDRRKQAKLKMQDKTAEMIDQFNKLVDDHDYVAAELVAKRLHELNPDEVVVQQVWRQAKMLRREFIINDNLASKEQNNWRTFQDVEDASHSPVGDGHEILYGKNWSDFKDRKPLSGRSGEITESERVIREKLRQNIQVKYTDRPLSEVVDSLSQLTGINIHLDQRGLRQEGVSSDTPITLDLSNQVMLKSALNLMLGELHLAYVVKDEVLMITSEQRRDGEVEFRTYNVADLVTPSPNFVPSNNIGLQSLINDAHAALGYGAGVGAPGPMAFVNNQPQVGPDGQPVSKSVLANQMQQGTMGGGMMGGGNVPMGMGPGGMGGGANADFDGLIDLIVSTVASETWAENGGGEAEIRPFEGNLSLIISQTQAVHEQIEDLLEQLRRLQDLQITIEVRFIRLNDSFFERIGVDFDMNVNDNTTGNLDLFATNRKGSGYETPRGSQVVGLSQSTSEGLFPSFTSDLDVPFRQGGFGVAVPQFGGFDPSSAASFGFAILSDIEAYFLINAAQGDQRTNVLNAPKVTLFNGQTAFVADTSQSPFVISVIPVVGEFAAAQQPVIVVLSEGTLMNIQAVVSDDRKYVRLTVVPFFSQIGDVDTFTFEGSTSTSSSSSSTDEDNGDNTNNSSSNQNNNFTAGTTVQLPTFSFVSVSTTVSVPDGGTVLLGGIKRLSEGRNEAGIPLLSKLPYVNRLFRNVGIGRETDSLMMMVTPRIIIQEEEE